MYNFKQILGTNVKYLREHLNLSQEVLGERVKVSTKSINYIENGRNFASPETLSSFCSEFNCLPEELFKINERTKSDDINEIKNNINRALNSCEINQLKEIEKYIYTMVLSK